MLKDWEEYFDYEDKVSEFTKPHKFSSHACAKHCKELREKMKVLVNKMDQLSKSQQLKLILFTPHVDAQETLNKRPGDYEDAE